MNPEYVALVAAFFGSGVLGALITSWFSRRKTGAESEHIRMQTADMLITKLSLQLNDAFERIRSLEVSERRLQQELDELKTYVHDRGLPWPLMP
jgi:hypothetical protein